jgi:hypothetical protein
VTAVPGIAGLRGAALACHCALLAAVAIVVLGGAPTSARALAAALAAAPLIATLRPLAIARRAALPWLAVLLVAYTGAAIVEVVASAGAERAAAVALLAAVGELGVVLALTRRLAARAAPRG